MRHVLELSPVPGPYLVQTIMVAPSMVTIAALRATEWAGCADLVGV